MTQNQDREAMKDEIKREYSDLFNKLTESEQIRTESVLNSNFGGKWATIFNPLDFTEDIQTVDDEVLTIQKK